MRYYIKYSETGEIQGYMEYEFENQTMTEVTEDEYFTIRAEQGIDDSEHFIQKYESETQRLIAEKYPPNEETKILREYLAEGDVKKAEFDTYNNYVNECKAKSHIEVYGITSESELGGEQ